MTVNKTVQAFDRSAIFEGNRALEIDHETVALAVDQLLSSMTLTDKLDQLRGSQTAPVAGLYYAGGNADLAIPAFKMVDGPRGARAGEATAFPVAMARGATFDVLLERRVGIAIGLEVAAKGGNVVLAPTINLLRHPGWGRAQETYSEDPWLLGAMGLAFVCGAQNHVMTSPKHFAVNNQENTRFDMSADIADRALHEVYLPHFKRCVKEGACASVMSAYNKVNGTYCGENATLLNDILRTDWGFKGFVESDWFLGTRSTAPALRAGLDIEMPAAYRFSDENIAQALHAGELDESDITAAARRVLHQKLAWRLDELPEVGPAVIECDEHRSLAREVAEKSLVLLKNDASILPLADRSDLKIAIFGDLADTANLGDKGSSFVTSSQVITPLAGIIEQVQYAHVQYFAGDSELPDLSSYDVCLVFAGLSYRDEGEFIPTAQQETEGGELARGGDREVLTLPESERRLIEAVVATIREGTGTCKTVVVLEGGSAIEIRDWVDSVDALLMAWYPGCEGGRAIASVLFGAMNPSGKLPVSFPRSVSQLNSWDVTALSVEHDLLHGYRYLDHHREDPEYAFGFGLSYTTFELSQFHLSSEAAEVEIVVRVTNTGSRAGACVVQLYVSQCDSCVYRVPKELKGFGRVELEAGESADVLLALLPEELSYYGEDTGEWVLEACTYQFQMGFSSDDLPLEVFQRFDGRVWHAT